MKISDILRITRGPLALTALLVLSLAGCSSSGGLATSSARNTDGVVFQTPEAALAEMKSAFASGDPKRVVAIYGEMSRDVIITGDPVADAAFMKKISDKLTQRAELIPVSSSEHPDEQWYKVRFSVEGWNARIPLVNRGDGWRFATEYAKDSVAEMRREINEVLASDTLFLLAAAQKEYFNSDPDQDGVKEYAQKIISTEGKKDGLYWNPALGGPKSPLDAKVGEAIAAGYSVTGKASPYFGYRYKILTGRAVGQKGKAQSFLNDGKMTGGFAIVAYPVTWGVSGSKTLIIDSNGRLYKKDLGFRTESIASDMTDFRLDSTWPRVEHPELGLRL